MHGRSDDNGPERIARFWRNYRRLLAKSRISERAMPWYRRHVEGFISAHGGRRLSDHDARSVSVYLEGLGWNPRLEAREDSGTAAYEPVISESVTSYQRIRGQTTEDRRQRTAEPRPIYPLYEKALIVTQSVRNLFFD